MHTLLPKDGYKPLKRKVNLLVYLNSATGPQVLLHLLARPDLNITVVSDVSRSDCQRNIGEEISLQDFRWITNRGLSSRAPALAHKLAQWADLLLLVADCELLAQMLAGCTQNAVLHTVRCWNASKKILVIPEMSEAQQANPMTQRQMNKIQKRWKWVQVLETATISFADGSAQDASQELSVDDDPETICVWHGAAALSEIVRTETQTILRRARQLWYPQQAHEKLRGSRSALPPEVWTQVMEYLSDWELATALGVYTQIPVPKRWVCLIPKADSDVSSLEWILLTKSTEHVRIFVENQAKLQALSAIAVELILRFELTDVLTYLASQQKALFRTSFPTVTLPHKASVIYNSPKILQWWKDCPFIQRRDCGPEAIDQASRAGFIDVLQWWLDSGLEMKYTERALENASACGLVDVLEWWRSNHFKNSGTSRPLELKVGKSIWLAAQQGRAQAIAWWDRSGIAYMHEEKVATVASQAGSVEVLDLWYGLKGSKMIFDNQVLVGPTKHGKPLVLQWWKEASRKYGLRVEYKTCDIEEAMEDAVGGGGETEVREWWSRNGLNLGVGTGEWMQVKTL